MDIGWRVRVRPPIEVYLVASKSVAAVIQNHFINHCGMSNSWWRCVRVKSESHHICSIRPKIWIDFLFLLRRRGKEKHVSTIDGRLRDLDIALPDVMPPVVDGYVPAFAPFVRSGDQIQLSGRLGKKNGKPLLGKWGEGIILEQGKLAARGVAMELLPVLKRLWAILITFDES